MISTEEFLRTVIDEIKDYNVSTHYNTELANENKEIIQVWYSKTIQNHKGLFIIKDKRFDYVLPLYIEATYNGDKKELYLDVYNKIFHHTESIN